MELENFEYHCLGFDPETKTITYIFVNPFRKPEHGKHPIFDDSIRGVDLIENADGSLNMAMYDEMLLSVAESVFNQMKAMLVQYDLENTPVDNVAEIISIFGEMPPKG